MNYFYSDKNSGVMGPYTKEEITEFYREGIISDEAILCVEGTQNWFPVRGLLTSHDLAVRMRHKPEIADAVRVAAQSTNTIQRWSNGAEAHSYLQHIRENSCYPTLRSVITIITILSFIALAIMAAGPLLASQGTEYGNSSVVILYCVGVLIFGSVGILASRQAALLFVDLVDANVERNARRSK